MKLRILFGLILTLSLFGCDKEDDVPTLDNQFSMKYLLEDFNLSESVDYWELRLDFSPYVSEDISDYKVVDQYDVESYAGLDDMQIELLEGAESQSGFDYGCYPGGCTYYAAAISGYDVSLVDTRASLKAFLGDIDTEAELAVWLSHSDYAAITIPITYSEIDDGYLVVLEWDSTCRYNGIDLIKVYFNGEIKRVKELRRWSSNYCA